MAKTEDKNLRSLIAIIDPRGGSAAGDVSWDEVLACARSLRVAPLVHRRMEQEQWEPPAAVRQELVRAGRASALQALKRLKALERLLEALGACGIPVALLKGSDFAYTLYAYPALRPMRDIDVLVPRERLEEAETCLRELGYRLGTDLREWYLREHYHLQYRSDQVVELHWHLHPESGPFRIPVEELWQRSAPVDDGPLAGALRLEPEDHFLYVCVHIAKDAMLAGLLPYLDLVTLLRGHELRWRVIEERARAWNALRAADLVLTTLGRLFPGAGGGWDRPEPPGDVVEASLRQALETDPAGHQRRLAVSRWNRLRNRLEFGREEAAPVQDSAGIWRRIQAKGSAYLPALWDLLRDPSKRKRSRDGELVEDWLNGSV